MKARYTPARFLKSILYFILFWLPQLSHAQGDICDTPLNAAFCPVQVFNLKDSVFHNDVTDWNVAGMNHTPGQDAFISMNFPIDTAIGRTIVLDMEVAYLSAPTGLYILWFDDSCGSAPVAVDSFALCALPGCGNSICYKMPLQNFNSSYQRVALDLRDSVSFDFVLSLGYISIHADTVCEDSFAVNTGLMELDKSMCGDSLHLPVDTSMLYLPGNMPAVTWLRDASPFNNGYLVTVKKVSANLGMYNHPFENVPLFAIDTANQDYCDIIVTLFIKNSSGREAINALRLELDNNFDVLTPLARFGSFLMPQSTGYYNVNGNWSGVYNPPNHELIWEFQSSDGRGDIDVYGPYSCKAYHFGFRAKVSLNGAPFKLKFSVQGDGWGDSVLASSVCGNRQSGCYFKCRSQCMSVPGQQNFYPVNSPSLDFTIDGGECSNRISEENDHVYCSAQPIECVQVGTHLPVMLYEGITGMYKVAYPVNENVCPDSCRGRVTTMDTAGCTQELYFSRLRNISTLKAHDNKIYYLCPGDTLVIDEDNSMPDCQRMCVSCFSNLVDSNKIPVAYHSGKYFITQAGRYDDIPDSSSSACVSFRVLSTEIEVNTSIASSNCDSTCTRLTAMGDSQMNYHWYWRDGSFAALGKEVIICHADTQTITLNASLNASCNISKNIFLAKDTFEIPVIELDHISPIPCMGNGTIQIHCDQQQVVFAWSNSSSQEDLVTSVAGSYRVTATNHQGCSDTAEFDIANVPPFTVSFSAKDSVCENEEVSICASPSGNYNWSSGETSACIQVKAFASEVHSVTITDANSCSATADFQFSFVDDIRIQANITDVPCYSRYNDGAIELEVTNNGVGEITFTWGHQSGGQHLYGLSPGNYSLTVSDEMGCSFSMNHAVLFLDIFHLEATPPADTIKLGETIALRANHTGSELTELSWSPTNYLDCDNCSDPVAAPPVSWVYVVTGVDTNQCHASDTIQITVIPDYRIYIPNAFTPNQDGLNDTWGVLGNLEGIARFHLSVYNRWGEKVFGTENCTDTWDGTYKGQDQTIGVFMYVINITWKDGHFDKLYEGSLTLLR